MLKFFTKNPFESNFYMRIGSYALIIILSISINLIGYVVAQQVLQAKIQKSNHDSVDKVRIVCDNMFQEIISEAHTLLLSNSLRKLTQKNTTDYDRQVYVSVLMSEIARGDLGAGKNDCGVFIRDKDLCVQNRYGVTDLHTIYNSFYYQYFESEENWREQIFQATGASFQILRDSKGMNNLFILFRLPNDKPDCTIIIRIDVEEIEKLLLTSIESSEQSFVTSKNGTVLFRSEGELQLETFGEQIFDSINYSGSSFEVEYVESEIGELRYVRTVPTKEYMRELDLVKLAFVFSYILCIVIAGILAWFFATLDEKRRRKTEQELQRQYEVLREDVTLQILKGHIKNEKDIPECYQGMLLGVGFVVVLFDMTGSNYLDTISFWKHKEISRDFEKRFTSLSNRISAYFCSSNGIYAGLLKYEETEPDMENLKKLLKGICEHFTSNQGLPIRCIMSVNISTPVQISETYFQALERLHMSYFEEDKDVYTCDEVHEAVLMQHFSLSANVETSIIDMVLIGNYNGVASLIDKELDRIVLNHKGQFGVTRIFFVNIISDLMKLAMQLNMGNEIDYNGLFSIFMQQEKNYDLSGNKRIILNELEKLCNISTSVSEEENKNWRCLDIENYIKKQYMDPQLNVNKLLDVFKVSSSWLSKNFRYSTGMSVLEYLMKYRLEKSKELLSTNMTISQIVEATGFSSDVAYYRMFKKHEKMTPSQYRELILKKRANERKEQE